MQLIRPALHCWAVAWQCRLVCRAENPLRLKCYTKSGWVTLFSKSQLLRCPLLFQHQLYFFKTHLLEQNNSQIDCSLCEQEIRLAELQRGTWKPTRGTSKQGKTVNFVWIKFHNGSSNFFFSWQRRVAGKWKNPSVCRQLQFHSSTLHKEKKKKPVYNRDLGTEK